jgi:hypothetical protein
MSKNPVDLKKANLAKSLFGKKKWYNFLIEFNNKYKVTYEKIILKVFSLNKNKSNSLPFGN